MRLKIYLFVLLGLSLLLTLSASALYLDFKNNIMERVDLKIYTWADDLVVEVAKNPEKFKKKPAEFLKHPGVNEFMSAGTLVQFMDKSGNVVAKSEILKHSALPFFKGEDDVLKDVELEDGTKLKVYQRMIDIEGESFGYVSVALPTATLYGNLDELRNSLVFVMLFTILIVGGVIGTIVSLSIADNQKRFLAFASHELRTPLSVISGYAEIALRKEQSQDEYKEALSVIKDESDWMNRLVNNLLYIFRSRTGMEAVKKDFFDLSELISSEQKSFAGRFPKKNITSDITPDIKISGDAGQIQKMADNLMENAVRYTKDNGKITISLRKDKKDAILGVADDGPGIKRNMQKKIFNAFYRVEEGSSQGFGLGLAICKWVAEAHGGKIKVISEYGKGSVFIVSLPIRG